MLVLSNRMFLPTYDKRKSIEPEVKEEAESILNQIGVPSSVVINMLYKQIIYTRGIPFALTLNHEPVSREEMTDQEFDSMIETGLAQAKAGKGRSTSDVAKSIKKKIKGKETRRNS